MEIKKLVQFMAIGTIALSAMNVQAGIIGVDDHAEEIITLPVTSLANGAYESLASGSTEGAPLIRVIHEKQNHTLISSIDFDDVSGGGAGTILAGTTVNSYLAHFDQFGTSGSMSLPGEIWFDSDILGIIFTSSKLNASDGELGLTGVTYSTSSLRDLEITGGLGADRYGFIDGTTLRTDYIEFEMLTSYHIDEMRIITAASPVPVPAAVWLFGSALLGLTGIGKRKKS